MMTKICMIGMGYVGLPLGVALSKHFEVIGFDINKKRIEELKKGYDWSKEISEQELKEAKIQYTNDAGDIKKSNFIIVTVPTPITKANAPDLEPVRMAGEIIGKNIQKGAIVVLESTVYPGVTEEYLAPIIEKNSGLKCGTDFKVGYSPERINPGDKEHAIDKVIKVVSGMDAESLEIVAHVYSKACKAGVFKAASIKTAEAAKVIENTQRDLNIALMNELSIIFHKLGIRTKDVLDAAGTKWNFLKFHPGLVGGHCIGVDPYYLTYKAEELGYHPEIILAGRRINDNMAKYVVDLTVRHLNKLGKTTNKSTILVLGMTFKENVKDYRNSKVADIIKELKSYGANVLGYDPMLDGEDGIIKHEFGINNTPLEKIEKTDAVIMAVKHKKFETLTLQKLKQWMPEKPLLIDLHNFFKRKEAEGLGFVVENL